MKLVGFKFLLDGKDQTDWTVVSLSRLEDTLRTLIIMIIWSTIRAYVELLCTCCLRDLKRCFWSSWEKNEASQNPPQQLLLEDQSISVWSPRGGSGVASWRMSVSRDNYSASAALFFSTGIYLRPWSRQSTFFFFFYKLSLELHQSLVSQPFSGFMSSGVATGNELCHTSPCQAIP